MLRVRVRLILGVLLLVAETVGEAVQVGVLDAVRGGEPVLLGVGVWDAVLDGVVVLLGLTLGLRERLPVWEGVAVLLGVPDCVILLLRD